MAVTKIKPIKSTLSKALDYIQNPDKTDGKMLVSSFGCSYETADIEFGFTLAQAIDKGNNLAHHLIQSFEPGEVDYEKAHEIGKQLADAVTKGQHEYVLTTHIDKGHIHTVPFRNLIYVLLLRNVVLERSVFRLVAVVEKAHLSLQLPLAAELPHPPLRHAVLAGELGVVVAVELRFDVSVSDRAKDTLRLLEVDGRAADDRAQLVVVLDADRLCDDAVVAVRNHVDRQFLYEVFHVPPSASLLGHFCEELPQDTEHLADRHLLAELLPPELGGVDDASLHERFKPL